MLNKVGVCLFTRSVKEAKQESLSSLYIGVWRVERCVWGSQASKLVFTRPSGWWAWVCMTKGPVTGRRGWGEDQVLIAEAWGLYYKTFYGRITDFCNKLECLSLASLSSLVQCLQVRPELTWAKYLSCAPL